MFGLKFLESDSPAGALVLVAVSALLSVSWLKYRGLEYIIIHYRWIFVVFFLMPLSLVYDVFFYLRNWLIFRMNSAPEKHDEKVRDVQQQVPIDFLIGSGLCRV